MKTYTVRDITNGKKGKKFKITFADKWYLNVFRPTVFETSEGAILKVVYPWYINFYRWCKRLFKKKYTAQDAFVKFQESLKNIDEKSPQPEEINKWLNQAQDKLLQKYIDDKTTEQ
jgi:hypothetical protein